MRPKTKYLENRERKRRKTLPGFPWTGKFQTIQKIEAYFSGDKIQCLLCGKWYRQINGTHLAHIHNTTADEYRERYGLPWSRGLTSNAVHDSNRQRTKQRMKEGFVPRFCDEEFRQSIIRPTSQRTVQPFSADLSTKKALAVHGRKIRWQTRDYEAILTRMKEQQRTLSDVCKDSDLPGKRAWDLFVKMYPDFAARAQQIHFSLPYSTQIKSRQKVSPRFRRDCQRLRKKGFSTYKIADALGVSQSAVYRALIFLATDD